MCVYVPDNLRTEHGREFILVSKIDYILGFQNFLVKTKQKQIVKYARRTGEIIY